MATQEPHKPRVFVDANVLFAGAASPSERRPQRSHSARLVVLRLAEITLIEALTSEQVIVEAERIMFETFNPVTQIFKSCARASLCCASVTCWPT